MNAIAFLRYMRSRNNALPAPSLNLWKSLGARPYATAKKVESSAHSTLGETKSKLSFEQFQRLRVKSLEEFKKSPAIQQICGDDITKVSQAYNDYCKCKYTRYLQSIYGGNPATMI